MKEKSEKKKQRRTKGLGSLFTRNGVYYYQNRENGRVITRSLKCTTYEDAEEKAKEFEPSLLAKTREEIALHIGQARKLQNEKKVLLPSVWHDFKDSTQRKGCNETSLKRYEQYWNRFLLWLSYKYPSVTHLTEISDEIAQDYFKELFTPGTKKYGDREIKCGISGRAYNAHLQALRLVYRIASNDSDIPNPFRESVVSKKEMRLVSRKEFSEEDVLKLLNSFNNKKLKVKNKEEMRVLFNLGAWTGLRLGDCALIEWSSIDLENNRIECMPIKTIRTGRTVQIPIHKLLKEALLKLAGQGKSSGYVLPKTAELYKSNPFGLQKELREIFKFSKFHANQKITTKGQRLHSSAIYGFHSFRHSFVSFCAKGGIPLAVVQSIVGHGNPAMTRHYSHIGEESTKKAIAALPFGENKQIAENGESDKLNKIRTILDSEKDSALKKKILKILK